MPIAVASIVSDAGPGVVGTALRTQPLSTPTCSRATSWSPISTASSAGARTSRRLKTSARPTPITSSLPNVTASQRSVTVWPALGTAGWGISLALGLTAGAILAAAGVDGDWWLLGIAMATTALGTLVPILGDAGLLGTPLGSAILGTGVAGEFWPIVVMSMFLTGIYGAGIELILLIGFGAAAITYLLGLLFGVSMG